MKIVLFIGGLSGGGAERVVANLSNYLADKGYQVEILTMIYQEKHYDVNSGVLIKPLLYEHERKNVVLDFIKRYYRLARYMQFSNCDCYIVFLPITILMMLSLKFLTKSPIIASERNNPKSYGFLLKTILNIYKNKASGWVFQNREQSVWYNSEKSNFDSIIIQNAINDAFLNCNVEINNRRKTIITVGRLNKQKNQLLLLKAFNQISNKFPDYCLEIYGKGEEYNCLNEYVNSHNLSKKVQFYGYVSDIPRIIKNSSLFVLTSDYEGIPNALIEAMSLGLPCISTDCDGGGARLLINHGQNGLLVKKDDVDELIAAMDRVLSNDDYAMQLGKNAYSIRNILSPDIIYSKWENFMLAVIAKSSHSTRT